jgi:alpha-1,6-mannosyltransferase
LVLAIGLGLLGSVGLALFGTVVGALTSPTSSPWWFSISLSHRSAIVGFYASLGLFAGGWAWLGLSAHRGQLSLKTAWVALAAWATPLLVGPPLFSRDLYSYVVQGLLAAKGHDPYHSSPSLLHANPAFAGIATVWQHTPAPYGPLSVLATTTSVRLAGGSLSLQIIFVRLPAVLGVLLMGFAIPRIARRLGADPALGFWLGVLSPLTLISLVGSGHNDALMLGVMLLGVLVLLHERFVLGTALGAAAAAVKLPAALIVLFPLMSTLRRSREGRGRLLAVVILTAAIVLVALSLLAGFGFGWLSLAAFKIPAELKTLVTPSVAVGVFLAAFLHVLGSGVATSSVVAVTRTVGSVLTVGALLWLLWNVHRYEWVRILGVALLVLALGSPTLWPWYLLWGTCVLAATLAQRSLALSLAASLPVLLVGAQGTPALTGHSYLYVVPLLALGAGYLVTGARWRRLLGADHA